MWRDEFMDEMGTWYDEASEYRQANCNHKNVHPVQVTDETVQDVCDDCGLGLGKPYAPNP